MVVGGSSGEEPVGVVAFQLTRRQVRGRLCRGRGGAELVVAVRGGEGGGGTERHR